MSFDEKKCEKIVSAFFAALELESSNAAEACAAATVVFQRAIEQAPAEQQAQLMKACRDVIDGKAEVTGGKK